MIEGEGIVWMIGAVVCLLAVYRKQTTVQTASTFHCAFAEKNTRTRGELERDSSE